jgi:hypothetical protein
MSNVIKISIDVTKIDKEKLYTGKKGTYLDAALIPTPNNQYGDDYMIVQGISKEEREAGQKGNILGNAKLAGQEQRPKEASNEPDPGDDEIAF